MRNYAHERMTDARRDGCTGCTYWRQSAGTEATGECRNQPPQRGVSGATAWPQTPYNGWCGAWISNVPSYEEEE